MRAVFDHQIFALQRFGGVTRYFLELAQGFSLYCPDIQATVAAPFHISPALEGMRQSGRVKVVGRKIPALPGKHRFLPLLNRVAGGYVVKGLQPDLIHETYYAEHPVACGCPRVLTVYDMIHERFPDRFSGADVHIPRIKARAVARADHLFAISNSARDDLVELLGVAPGKITVTHLAASLEPPAAKEGGQGRPYLLYVGLRGGVKNFQTLLHAYVRSKAVSADFDLVCVGGGPFSAEEQATVAAFNMAGRVRQVEADDRLLASFYANAALFVYPSLYEGFGLPVLEAMRCGCPVACGRVSSLPEIAGDAALYFDPGDGGDMQSVLESFVLSEYPGDRWRAAGYEQERKFSWEKCVRQTAEVYRKVVR